MTGELKDKSLSAMKTEASVNKAGTGLDVIFYANLYRPQPTQALFARRLSHVSKTVRYLRFSLSVFQRLSLSSSPMLASSQLTIIRPHKIEEGERME